MEIALRKHIDALCSEPRWPGSPGYAKAQAYLKNCIREMGLEVREQSFGVWGKNDCLNIYAESHPSSSDPVVLIGAHYESRECSGLAADDNASAVAVAIEVAKNLIEKKGPPFVLIFFDMEEIYKFPTQDLQGSKAFSTFYPKPLDRVVIMDLVGGTLAPHFEKTYLQFGGGLPKLDSENLAILHLPMVVVEPMGSLGPRSDYHAFRNQNIPFTFISSGTPWYYHTEFDTPDILNFEKMAKLVDALTKTLLARSKNQNDLGTANDFLEFAKTFQKTPALQHPLFEKLLSEGRTPSRFEMIRLYKHILPKLRKFKSDLWKMTA